MAAKIRSVLADLGASRRAIFQELAAVPEERMAAENTWSGQQMDVRFFFLRFADHEEEHALQVARTLAGFGFRQTEAQQILGAAEMTRGDLYGALVGLTDADLDLEPEGEWPLRRTLAHVIQVERSYTRATSHAAARYRAGLPWERHAPVEPEPEAGTLDDFLARLDAAREAALAELSGLEGAVMPAPAVWADIDVDVRFRLMRFAHHEREHTAHILKWRRQVARQHSEAQHLLGLAWRARGLLESYLVGVPDDYLERRPEGGDRTIRQILEHISRTEAYLKGRIEGATLTA